MKRHSIIWQRNRALDAVYKRIIKASRGVRFLSRKTVIALIQEQTAPRFYITPETAKLYIRGNRKLQKSLKPNMVADLIENFNRLVAENPNAPKEWLYEIVVEQPAKSFYMSDHRIAEVIFNYSGRNGK